MMKTAGVFCCLILLGACSVENVDAPTIAKDQTAAPVPSTGQPLLPPTPDLPESRLEDVDFAAYSTELAGPLGLTLGETRLATVDKIRLYFAPEPGVNMIQTTSQTFERDDGSVFLFARNAIPDDSLKAQEVYAVFSGPGGAEKFDQKLAAYGMRIKCYRGENTTEWQTELCP